MEKNRLLQKAMLIGWAATSIAGVGCESLGFKDTYTAARSDLTITMKYPRGWEVREEGNHHVYIVNKELGSIEIKDQPNGGSLSTEQIKNDFIRKFGEERIKKEEVKLKVSDDSIDGHDGARYEIDRLEGDYSYKEVGYIFIFNGQRWTISYSLNTSDPEKSPSEIKKMEDALDSVRTSNP